MVTEKVDIANVRMEFESGCVANLTASRISTERVRKLRFFQPKEYVSIDYGRQDVFQIRVTQEEKFSLHNLMAFADNAFQRADPGRNAEQAKGGSGRTVARGAEIISACGTHRAGRWCHWTMVAAHWLLP